MDNNERIQHWVDSYKALAEKVVAYQVNDMKAEFPDERYPVRPPYRKAMYQRMMVIVDELNYKMNELLEESPDETDEALKQQLMELQEGYEQEFLRQVPKEEDKSVEDDA